MQTKTFLVSISVAQNWIDDGFSIEPAHIQEMIETALEDKLPYSYAGERAVSVKQAPKTFKA